MASDLTPSKLRIAVVLFNLGGPDGQKAVRPFLMRLFSDPAIISLPAILRLPLAWLISTGRAAKARANYRMMGGGSPLLPQTRNQAAALEKTLQARPGCGGARTFIAMRYWDPLAAETAKAVADFAPDEVVLLPLYPQYSTTTTASSIKAWKEAYKGPGKVREVCCYPVLPGLIDAHVRHIEKALPKADGAFRLLFSAHGLPEKIVAKGDPYQRQIEATAKAIADRLDGDIDWRVCYQSRVGRLKWIGPTTPEAIESACAEGIGVVIAPISFVSEHIETLVELDYDYNILAETLGCPTFVRVPTLGTEEAFIGALADATIAALARSDDGRAAPGAGWTADRCGPICPCLQGGLA